MEKRKVKLNVCGVELTIATENSEEEALNAAAALDQSIRGLMTYNNRVSTTVASILTALRYYDDLQSSKRESDNLRAQLKVYFEDSERMRKELSDLQKENGSLKEELRLIRVHMNPDASSQELTDKVKNFVTAKPSGRYIKKTLDDIVPQQQNFITFFEKENK